MSCQLEHALRAHPRRPHLTRQRRISNLPSYVGVPHRPHHAQRRGFARLAGNGTTLPKAPSITPAETPSETRAPLRAASSNRSASSATASRRCSSLSRAKRGSNLISVRLPSSFGNGRGANGRNELRRGPAQPHPFPTEKPFRSPGSDVRDGRLYIDRRF